VFEFERDYWFAVFGILVCIYCTVVYGWLDFEIGWSLGCYAYRGNIGK
jgi:hypothetical protein